MKQLFDFETAHPHEMDEKFHPFNIGNIGNVIYWWKYFEMIQKVPGSIVECGIGRGRSLIVLSAINAFLDEAEGGQRKVFGYDSFEGFPEPSAEDESYRNPQKGEWSTSPSGKYQYSPDFMRMVLREAKIPNVDDIVLTKGYFSDTCGHHPNEPIALLHVDGDLYQSYIDTLTSLYPKVSPGGLVVFDDYLEVEQGEDRWPGARKAVQDFFGPLANQIKTSVRGTQYLVKPI
jgi:hypothetical protein